MNEQQKRLNKLNIDRNWCIFLDRDGVINKDPTGDYVKSPDEFVFLAGSVGAIVELNKIFKRIIIVTNQRGIARGLMLEQDLTEIHQMMLRKLEEKAAFIDTIKFCPHNNYDNCNCRKPKTGMVEQAMVEFPDINPDKSFIVGDKLIDMELGRNAGMKTVYVKSGSNAFPYDARLMDFEYDDLSKFTSELPKLIEV